MQVLKVTARQINNVTCSFGADGLEWHSFCFVLLQLRCDDLERLCVRRLCGRHYATPRTRRYSGGRVVKADPIRISAAQDYEILQYKLNFTSAQTSWGRIRRLRLWRRSVSDDKSGHNLKAFLTMDVLIVALSRLRVAQVNKNTDK